MDSDSAKHGESGGYGKCHLKILSFAITSLRGHCPTWMFGFDLPKSLMFVMVWPFERQTIQSPFTNPGSGAFCLS